MATTDGVIVRRRRVRVPTTGAAALVVVVALAALSACGGGPRLAAPATASTSRSSTVAPASTTTITLIGTGGDEATADTTPTSTRDTTAAPDTVPAADPLPANGGAVEPGPADLVGAWLGPMPGDTGRCGSAVSEWTLGADGSYQVANRSTDCGGFTVFGAYSADGTSIAFEQQGSDCPTCIQTASYSVEYSFLSDTNSLQIVDGTQSFILHRE